MEVHPFRLATNREVRLSKVDIDACRMPCRPVWAAIGGHWLASRVPQIAIDEVWSARYCFRPAEDVKNGAGHSRSHVISCRPV